MRGLQFEGRWVQEIAFSDTVVERHMERSWSHLNMNWGRIEFRLYSILLPIDAKQAHKWTTEFFELRTTQSDKERKIKKELKALTRDKEPQFITAFDKLIKDFAVLRNRRNPLAHGLWSRVSDGIFEVQPLRLAEGEDSIAAPVLVDVGYLENLVKLMSSVISQCACLGSETVAYEYLQRRKMELNIEIETRDKPFLEEIFNEPVIAEAKPIELGSGVILKGLTWNFRKGGGFPDLATLVIEFGIGVSSSVVAALLTAWLVKNKERIERVKIEKMEIEFDADKIKKIVSETITRERDSS